MKSEAAMWANRIRPILMQWPDAMAQRVENGIDAGTPDAFFTLDGISGWIENKNAPQPPKRELTPVFGEHRGLRKEQIVWWTVYLRAGGHGFLAIGVGDDAYMARAELQLIKDFNRMPMSEIRWRFTSVKEVTPYFFMRRA